MIVSVRELPLQKAQQSEQPPKATRRESQRLDGLPGESLQSRLTVSRPDKVQYENSLEKSI